MSRSGCRRLRPRNRKAPSDDQFAHDLTSGPPSSFHVTLRRPEKLKNAPGYASLPACSWQKTYFFSISPFAESTLEALRTQGFSSARDLFLFNKFLAESTLEAMRTQGFSSARDLFLFNKSLAESTL